MDKFIERFNEFTDNKYPYLRVKKVDIFNYEKRANIYFYIPEKIYENGFDNSLQKDLAKFCQKIARNMKCEFFFERLILSEELCKENVEEFFISRYPFISSSITKDCIKVEISDNITIDLTIEEDVFDVIEQTDFSEKLILFIQETYIYPTQINYNIVKKGDIKIDLSEELGVVSKKTVPIKSFEYLCGINSKQVNYPLFSDSILRASDNASVCGLIDDVRIKENEETEENKSYFKKYAYRLVLNDLAGTFTVYFKTNDDQCPLKDYGVGKEILAKGKIVYSVNLGKYVMYAKSIYKCELDVEKIKDALKPLPPPEKLKIPSTKYSGSDFITEQTLDDFKREDQDKDFDCVIMAYNSLSSDFIPWEITMLSFVNGKCDEVYDTFLRVSNLDAIEPEFKPKVNLSKRFADIIGDIICFTKGRQIVCQNPQKVLDTIKPLAKAQRYEFEPELIDADKLGMKVSKGEADLRKNLKNNGIVVKGERSYDLAIAIAKLYLKVKK